MSSAAVAAFEAELGRAVREVSTALNAVRVASARVAVGPDLQGLERDATRDFDAVKARVDAAVAGAEQDQLAAEAGRQVWRIAGRYAELGSRLNGLPFRVVTVVTDGLVSDIGIQVRDVPIPAESGTLKGEIDAATNVVQTVMAERKRRTWRIEKSRRRLILRTQDEYLKQLFEIARVGLETNEPTRAIFARLDLLRFTNLFTMREAGAIKNDYVTRLAVWAALAAAVAFALYLGVRGGLVCGTSPAFRPDGTHWLARVVPVLCPLVVDLRNFLLVAAGAAIGTWLSFSLRRQELAFADLAVLEPDRLNPSIRIVFMMCIACLVGLLFFTGAIIAGVGSVDGTVGLRAHGTWSLLLGLLAGVGERSLGTAVTRRSLDFVAAVGGTKPAGTSTAV